MMESRTGAAYVRVSTDSQMELSPESQLDAILEYAKEHNITISKEHIFMESEGRSGKKAENRPQFQQMIAAAKTKPRPFDCILVWKFSRFARNQDESTFYKGMLRKKLGIDVLSISEPVLDGMYGRLIEMIIEWQDEFYSYNLAQDVTRGMKSRAQSGGYQCRPPLGYRVPYHNAAVEIVPEEAGIVRMIFEKYVNERMSIFAITRLLNSLGLKTSRGKSFEKRSVEYILQNPAYAGIVRWNRVSHETKKIKDRSEWIISQGHHPPIISEELYNQAISRYESECTRRNAKPAEQVRHWLGGILKCSDCGRSLSSCQNHRKKGETCYSFQCCGYLKGKCSSNHYISEKHIVPAVMNSLREALSGGSTEYEIIKKQENKEPADWEPVKSALKKLELKERRAKDAYIDGIDTLEEYKTNKQILLQERETLETLLLQPAAFSSEENSGELCQQQKLLNIRSVIDILESDSFTAVQKNAALKSIVSKIVFNHENMHIDVFYAVHTHLRDG